MLAGVSVEYYKRLERGNLGGVSDLVLEGLANELALDDAASQLLGSPPHDGNGRTHRIAGLSIDRKEPPCPNLSRPEPKN